MPAQHETIASSSYRRQLLLYTVATSFLIGTAILGVVQLRTLDISDSTRSLLQIFGFVILTLPVFVLMQAYLEPTLKRSLQAGARQNSIGDEVKKMRSETNSAIVSIHKKINELDLKISETSFDGFATEQFRSDIAREIRAQIERQASTEFLDEIERQATYRAEGVVAQEENFVNMDTARSRIETEIFDLGRRGNLNLVLGGVTSFTGVTILGISVYFQTTVVSDNSTLLTYFLPRLALALMIQVFAYFFLSLYRNSLQEIKYFQNEITNIEAKHAALSAAMHTKDNKIIEAVLISFAATERNHILLKNQTTVELEKIKTENGSNVATLHILKDLFASKLPSGTDKS